MFGTALRKIALFPRLDVGRWPSDRLYASAAEMLRFRDQRGLETKFNGLVLVLGLVVVVLVLVHVIIVLVLVHLGLLVSKFDYAKFYILLLLAMVTYYNSKLKCQNDSTNHKLNSGC